MFNLSTKPVSAGELMKKEKKPINFVVEKFISQGVHFLAGHPKSGKSWLSLWLALCVSNGNNLWGFKTNKSKVLTRLRVPRKKMNALRDKLLHHKVNWFLFFLHQFSC